MNMNKQQKEARLKEFATAAKMLSDDQRKEAMETLLDTVNETEAGIIRQILADPDKPLSEKQQAVFDKHIEPAMVEKCGRSGCSGFTMPEVELCPSCEAKFG